MRTHAALPVVVGKGPRRWLYFSGRDAEGRARVGRAPIDLSRGVAGVAEDRPVIDLGPRGAFDDNGVTSAWIVEHEGRQYQYYTGWHLGVSVPFYLAVGLAVSEDGGATFRKAAEGPILGTDVVDAYLTASPCVLVEGERWRMWYVSGSRWSFEQGQAKHYYHIRYAESADGVRWQRTGRVCIDYAGADEHAIARPCVVREQGLYKMWYCFRGARYRIGYAESEDGLSWVRKDEAGGLEPSTSGWDSEMTAYPFVFDEGGVRYMAYNGNGYGLTGVGLAALGRAARGLP
jgi:hypothetical protein